MPAISIIVPVYNAEKYIHKCIDSILSQTFADFELLLIDDGSRDNSGKICDEYANKDFRIKAFHKENGGVASARQNGMMHAIGEYLIHVDPDDWIDVDMLEYLYQEAKRTNADITVCDYNVVWHNGEIKKVNVNLPKDNIVCLKKILLGEIHSSLGNKLIKRSLYFDNGIFFICGLNMCEDLSVMFRLMYYAEKVAYIPKSLYNYLQGRAGSYTSSTMNLAQQKDAIALINLFEDFFRGKNVTSEIYKEIRYYKAGTLCKIALFGDIVYYRQTKDTFKDVRFIDLLTQPTVGIRRKVCGILLYCRCMFILNFIRKIRN